MLCYLLPARVCTVTTQCDNRVRPTLRRHAPKSESDERIRTVERICLMLKNNDKTDRFVLLFSIKLSRMEFILPPACCCCVCVSSLTSSTVSSLESKALHMFSEETGGTPSTRPGMLFLDCTVVTSRTRTAFTRFVTAFDSSSSSRLRDCMISRMAYQNRMPHHDMNSSNQARTELILACDVYRKHTGCIAFYSGVSRRCCRKWYLPNDRAYCVQTTWCFDLYVHTNCQDVLLVLIRYQVYGYLLPCAKLSKVSVEHEVNKHTVVVYIL